MNKVLEVLKKVAWWFVMGGILFAAGAMLFTYVVDADSDNPGKIMFGFGVVLAIMAGFMLANAGLCLAMLKNVTPGTWQQRAANVLLVGELLVPVVMIALFFILPAGSYASNFVGMTGFLFPPGMIVPNIIIGLVFSGMQNKNSNLRPIKR